jgi:hypothetical protein
VDPGLTEPLWTGRYGQDGRVRRPAAALCATLAVLGWAAAATAHPSVAPTFVTAGQRGTVVVVAPNERQTRMNGFSVTVPPRSLSIVSLGGSDVGWRGTVHGSTASWSGCCVAPGVVSTFSLELEATNEPGDIRLQVQQLYPDGEHVLWQVPLTVLPGEKESGSPLAVLLVAGVGLVVTVGIVVLLWLRQSPAGRET